jgi:CheY-like chemotaxis protein
LYAKALWDSKGRDKELLIGLLEDDLAIQEMLRLLFQGEGHEVTIYDSAEDCLADVRVDDPSPELPGPGLLLIDLRLSKSASGITVIERIRANSRLEALPIILMTASASLEKQKLDLLRVRLLTKPFDIDEIMQLIDELTGEARH